MGVFSLRQMRYSYHLSAFSTSIDNTSSSVETNDDEPQPAGSTGRSSKSASMLAKIGNITSITRNLQEYGNLHHFDDEQ